MEEIKIYSKSSGYEDRLLHMIYRNILDLPAGRKDIIDHTEFLQLSTIHREQGSIFEPHYHISHKSRESAIAQESWIVLGGSVEVTFFDLPPFAEQIGKYILNPFDISITLYGGHSYRILEGGTKVLEYKTGPYFGQELDKVFIK